MQLIDYIHAAELNAGGPGSGRRPYGTGEKKSGMITKKYSYVSDNVAKAAGFERSKVPGPEYVHPDGHTIASISDFSPKGHGFSGHRVRATPEMHEQLKKMNKLERQDGGYYDPPGKGWAEINIKK